MSVQPTGIKRLLYKLLNGYSPFSYDIQISITNKCNLSCWFCPIHSSLAEMNPMKQGMNLPDMTMSKFQQIINDAGKKLRSVAICGKGEPTLHKDFILMCRYLNQVGVDFTITTNGAKIKEHIKDLEDMKYCKGIRISIPHDNVTAETASLCIYSKVTFYVYEGEFEENSKFIKAKVVSLKGIQGDTLLDGINVQSCIIPFRFMFINSDGSVCPCCHSYDVMGHTNRQSLDEIFNNRHMRLFRKDAVKLNGNIMPCSDCHNCGHYAYEN